MFNLIFSVCDEYILNNQHKRYEFNCTSNIEDIYNLLPFKWNGWYRVQQLYIDGKQ